MIRERDALVPDSPDGLPARHAETKRVLLAVAISGVRAIGAVALRGRVLRMRVHADSLIGLTWRNEGLSETVLSASSLSRPHDMASASTRQFEVPESDITKGLSLYLKTKFAFHASDKTWEKVFREELVKKFLDIPLDYTPQEREFCL